MYIQPEFNDEFSSSLGVLEKPWTVPLGELVLDAGTLISPSCGMAVLPFTAESFGAKFLIAGHSAGSLLSLHIKVSSDLGSGFSAVVQDDLSVAVEAVWAEKSLSERLYKTAAGALSIGDEITLSYWVQQDGSRIIALLNGTDILAEIPVPEWALAMPDGGCCGVWLSGDAAIDDFWCAELQPVTLPMVPLQNSFDATQTELDIKNLFISAFNETLREQANEISVYGAPHLGSFALVERHVSSDGLAMLRQGDETGLRYLFKAWRFRNPRRGTAFLRTYLQVLFGNAFSIAQMWQDKELDYPDGLKSREEITYQALALADYFLTSRVRVDLDIDILPENIVKSLRTALAARFVLILRIAKFAENHLGIAQVAGAANVFYGFGETFSPDTMSESEWNFVNIAGASVVFNADGSLLGSYDPDADYYDPDAMALFARMDVEPSVEWKALISRKCIELKIAGLWWKLDKLEVYALHTEQASLLDWKGYVPGLYFPRTGGWIYGNGVSVNYDAGYSPYYHSDDLYTQYSTYDHADQYQQDSACILMGVNSRSGAESLDIFKAGTASHLKIIDDGFGVFNLSGNINSVAGDIAVDVTGDTQNGIWFLQRTAASDFTVHLDNDLKATGSSTSVSMVGTGGFVGAGNQELGGAPSLSYRHVFAAGAALTPTERATFVSIIEDFMASIPAP